MVIGALPLALDIVERIDGAKSAGAAGRAFFDALKPLGARGFGARAYDATGGSMSRKLAPGAFAQVLPAGWRGSASGRFIERLDPLPKAARRMRRPSFLWSDASPHDDPQWADYWDAFGQFGIGEGTAVHIFWPAGVTSRVTVAFARDALRPRERKAVELASFALLDRMISFLPAPEAGIPTLSSRERDCRALAAQGLSDSAIADKLKLAESTAHFYIEKAKRKLGARTRTQAVARLIAAGLL
jgi:DNA-binding CsgD family transcriptional regulator